MICPGVEHQHVHCPGASDPYNHHHSRSERAYPTHRHSVFIIVSGSYFVVSAGIFHISIDIIYSSKCQKKVQSSVISWNPYGPHPEGPRDCHQALILCQLLQPLSEDCAGHKVTACHKLTIFISLDSNEPFQTTTESEL